MHAKHTARAFSLIELVIVVVIIGIIGAIAIPRMSRGAEGASDSALVSNLAVLRNAIQLYKAEHQGDWPTETNVTAQLTSMSNITGGTGATDTGKIYGPYLRAVPPLPVGADKGNATISGTDGTGVGWLYEETTGEIVAATAAGEADALGQDYNTY